MSLSLEVKGNKIGPMSERLERLLSAVVRKAALDVEANAKANITGGAKTGRIYKRGRRVHQASAPGESPADDTGNLANSVKAERVTNLEWKVSVSAAYAFLLEFGGTRVLARPFLRPSVAKVQKVFERAVAAAIQKAAE